ncbi:MAG: hypothetical protein ACOX2S_02485 [bacterium]
MGDQPRGRFSWGAAMGDQPRASHGDGSLGRCISHRSATASHGDGSLGRCCARDQGPATGTVLLCHGCATGVPRGRFSWQVSDGGKSLAETSHGDGSLGRCISQGPATGGLPWGRFLWQVPGWYGPATGTVLLAGVGTSHGDGSLGASHRDGSPGDQPRGRFSWQVLMKERHSFDQRCLFLGQPRGRFSWQV